ncbi:MAG: hypothetical protein HZB80_11190 [Deltaproteobacteria bacterium]|nr:hypothetical protein [Deltaproteobacteria bacterium]
MKPIKALTGSIKSISQLHLHILLTEEDDVIVARCLDFSVSSHGESEEDALEALSDSIKDYLDYALNRGALNEIIDPEEDMLWEIYRKMELQNESLSIKERADILKVDKTKEVIYA